MKAAFFVGKESVEIREVPAPELSDDKVLVRVMASGICGSDKGLWMNEGEKPGIHGHEACGVVDAVGDKVTKWKRGDRVAVFAVVGCGRCTHCLGGKYTYCSERRGSGGGYAEYLATFERNLLPLPEEIPFERGCLLLDALGTPAKAARRVGVSEGDWVVVMGCGPIGASAVQVCKAFGARVVAADPEGYRRAHAQRLGADLTFDPTGDGFLSKVRDLTHGGADRAMDCSGNPAAEKLAIQSVRVAGRVVFVGENRRLEISPSEDLIRRDITLMGSWYLHRSDYFANLELMRGTGLDPLQTVTHTVTLDSIAQGFDVFCGHKEECLKVVVNIG